jgi:hypothetical protein
MKVVLQQPQWLPFNKLMKQHPLVPEEHLIGRKIVHRVFRAVGTIGDIKQIHQDE